MLENDFLFIAAVKPLVIRACKRLKESIGPICKGSHCLPFDPSKIEKLLVSSLHERLMWILGPTMALEINVALLQGGLAGKSPEEGLERYFESSPTSEGQLAWLAEYPVLDREIVTAITNWVAMSVEWARRLSADWDEIQATFSPEKEPEDLVAVDMNATNQHCGGRSTVTMKFRSGLQLIYKPCSIALYVHLSEMLAWLNRKGNPPSFRIIKVLARTDYGWLEFVEKHECATKKEVERYSERVGGYLALLFALGVRAEHAIRLVACGEHPILVDVEGILSPRLNAVTVDSWRSHIERTLRPVIPMDILRPVLASRAKDKTRIVGADGLWRASNESEYSTEPASEYNSIDKRRCFYTQIRKYVVQGRHKIDDDIVTSRLSARGVERGFIVVYETLMIHRDELFTDCGLLRRFVEDDVPISLRPAGFYMSLINSAFHTDLTRNAQDRDQYLNRLRQSVGEDDPQLQTVVASELRDLQAQDIPVFMSRPGSCDLWTSRNERIEGFFDESALSLISNHIKRLSEDRLAQHVQFIRAWFKLQPALSTSGLLSRGERLLPYVKRDMLRSPWLPEILLRLRSRIQKKSESAPARTLVKLALPWGLEICCRPLDRIGSSLCNLGVYDLVLSEAIWRLVDPGEKCIDVGAHVGYVTSLIVARVGPSGTVICYEPHPLIVEQLCVNAQEWRRGGARIEIYCVAASDSDQPGILHEHDDFNANSGRSSFRRLHEPLPATSCCNHNVNASTLDSCLYGGGDFALLKIDVEGRESLVLQGASRLIESQAIRDICFEDYGDYPSPSMVFLMQRGYTLFALAGGPFGPSMINLPYRNGVPRCRPPNYLATLDPRRAKSRLASPGWSLMDLAFSNRGRLQY